MSGDTRLGGTYIRLDVTNSRCADANMPFVANGSTGNLSEEPYAGFILRTDRQGGPNQFSDDFLGLVAITALKEEALLDFDEPVLDFDFMDEMHSENPVHIAMTAKERSRVHEKIRRGTIIWAVYAVVVDMLRTRYLRPLEFSVFYYTEHLYTGSITLRNPRPASNTISNQSLNEIPIDSTHILMKASAASRDQMQYTLHFKFVPPAPLPRPVLGKFSMFETLLAFVLHLAPRSSGSITPRTGMALGGLYAWVFMKEAVPPLRGFAFQQYQAVTIAEAIARYCVFYSRYDEVVFGFQVNGEVLASGCITKPIEVRRWCGRMPLVDSNGPPGNLTQSVATS
ncbi:hypothetical protein Q9189_002246 [Teloschistes chrysophthalmus]